MLNVGKSSLALFRVILKYINPGTEAVSGHVTIYPSWAEAGRQIFKPLFGLRNDELVKQFLQFSQSYLLRKDGV